MNPNTMVWPALAGLVLATWGAIGARALRDFSRRQLEIYCRLRQRRDILAEILTRHHEGAFCADLLKWLGIALMLVCGTIWLLPQSSTSVGWGPLAGVLALGTLLVLTTIAWVPRSLARYWSAPLLFHTWAGWRLIAQLLYPLILISGLFDGLIRRLAGLQEVPVDEEEAFEDEIRTMVTTGQREGLLEADAREMIEGVMELGDVDVSDIMTPRSRVDALDVELPWNEVLEFVTDVGRTRIPVYEGNLDSVVGILYVKDLLAELAEGPQPRRSLRSLLRGAWFVPPTQPVDDLLQDFLQTRNHMAIVVDEFRRVAGVVTIEDALEEIVGEIVDESDKEDHEEDILQVDDRTAEAVGQTHLDDLNERLGLNLPEPAEFDTIGGLVMSELGKIPKDGESIVAGNIRITVLRANSRRVERVRLETLPVPQLHPEPHRQHVE